MQRKVLDWKKGPYHEKHYYDFEEKKKYTQYAQEVDGILKMCHRERMGEKHKGNRFRDLLRYGRMKLLGRMPILSFITGGFAKKEENETIRWLEDKPEFKSTNAKLL